MEKMKFPRRFRVYVPLLCLFVLLTFLMPRNPKFNFDYKKGSPWMYETLVAQFDFPILKTESEFYAEKEAVASSVIPYYRLDPKAESVSEEVLAGIDFDSLAFVRTSVSSALGTIYSKGLVSDLSNISTLSDNSIIYVQKSLRAEKVPCTEIFTTETAGQKIRESILSEYPAFNADSLYDAFNLNTVLVPNLIYDKQTTELVHEQNTDYVSPTKGVVRAGSVIVSQGEIITAEIEQLLNSYKAEYDISIGYNGPLALLWTGNAILAFALVIVLFLSILYCNEKIFDQYNKYLYLLMIFSISAIGASLIAMHNPQMFYMIPFTLAALFLLAFFKKRVVYTVYIISLLPILLFAPNGVELYVIYLVAGIIGMLVFGFFNKGWLQFVTALIVYIVMVLVWLAFKMASGGLEDFNDYYQILYMALGALMTVAGYPLIYLFEKIFRLVSNSKLVELSDTSNPLLRLLADKAPGTFQHSLQVMNLADAAARAIDANVPLVRAGALYHDIGKIANPQCFTENENPLVKYHANLSVKESAQDIIRHVSDGIVLADKYSLPDELKEFILTHHGTSCTGYFYTKYVNEGGNPDDIADFCYNGKRPYTKEQVIMMICDSVEAASRSLKDYSAESISALVDRIIKIKDDEHQFSEADITVREVNIMRAEIKSYLQQMYHSRIDYPKRMAVPNQRG